MGRIPRPTSKGIFTRYSIRRGTIPSFILQDLRRAKARYIYAYMCRKAEIKKIKIFLKKVLQCVFIYDNIGNVGNG